MTFISCLRAVWPYCLLPFWSSIHFSLLQCAGPPKLVELIRRNEHLASSWSCFQEFPWILQLSSHPKVSLVIEALGPDAWPRSGSNAAGSWIALVATSMCALIAARSGNMGGCLMVFVQYVLESLQAASCSWKCSGTEAKLASITLKIFFMATHPLMTPKFLTCSELPSLTMSSWGAIQLSGSLLVFGPPWRHTMHCRTEKMVPTFFQTSNMHRH